MLQVLLRLIGQFVCRPKLPRQKETVSSLSAVKCVMGLSLAVWRHATMFAMPAHLAAAEKMIKKMLAGGQPKGVCTHSYETRENNVFNTGVSATC